MIEEAKDHCDLISAQCQARIREAQAESKRHRAQMQAAVDEHQQAKLRAEERLHQLAAAEGREKSEFVEQQARLDLERRAHEMALREAAKSELEEQRLQQEAQAVSGFQRCLPLVSLLASSAFAAIPAGHALPVVPLE